MSNKTFTCMSDHTAIVRLATRLGYKVYKESVDYEEDSPARYMVKNANGTRFVGAVLNEVLARVIMHDREVSHV